MKQRMFEGAYGPLLIAEIGGNHEGDFEYAKTLVELAISSNADCIKLQLYTGDTLVNPMESPQRNLHFKKFELSPEQYITLAKKVVDAGKIFTASVWNEAFFNWIDPFMGFYKVGSGDLTAYPLLRHITSYRKPIVISTGLAYEKEVLQAVKFIQSQDTCYHSKDWLAVLQCTSMYPISPRDVNLSVMSRFKELTGLTVGYSDHTEGYKTLVYAAAMGAEVLEFHFTDSREDKQFRDHKVSLTKKEVNFLTEEIQAINIAKGDYIKQPMQVEVDADHVVSFRRAVYPALDLKAGTVLEEKHLVTLRPNHGIGAEQFYELIGRTVTSDVKKYQPLDWSFVK